MRDWKSWITKWWTDGAYILEATRNLLIYRFNGWDES